MLFRDQHDNGSGNGTIGAEAAHLHSEDDYTSSKGGRSYTSADSSNTQKFERRMAQLNRPNGLVSEGSTPGSLEPFRKGSGNDFTGSPSAYLGQDYQLFPKSSNAYADPDSDDMDDVQHSLTMVMRAGVSGSGDADRDGSSSGGVGGVGADQYSKHTSGAFADNDDDDDQDGDYLAKLLSNIEKHAARLDTQFYRYPPSEVIKQQMAASAAATGSDDKARAAGGAGGGGDDHEGSDAHSNHGSGPLSPSASQRTTTGSLAAASPTSTSAHGAGTKLFLGGLRYEVIQSGRHMVSWIFQVACGVRLSPSSILIHRKTKNGRSNVAPTGCASVFVACEADVQALLDMNQRIYCAEEGVYVSPSPDVMKELIASKDIVDVTGGRVRGPTHPVVIERAYSVSHHHGHREGGGNGSGSGSGSGNSSGGGVSASGNGGSGSPRGGGNHTANGTNNKNGGGGSSIASRHARTPSSASTESNMSSQLRGAMPPPYGNVPPPQYGAATGATPMLTCNVPPPSYTPSAVSSIPGMGSLTGMPMSGSLPGAGSSTTLYPPSTAMSRQSSPSSQPLHADPMATSPPPVAKSLDPQRVTFHAYLRNDAQAHLSARHQPSSGAQSANHTVLFVAALPSSATTDYVSWLFSLMAIHLAPAHIHIIGGASSGGAGSAKNLADSCATINLDESDVFIALNFHHRVLCTPRGAWIGHSSQDIAALRASDTSLRDCPAFHIDRRMSAQTSTTAGGSGGGVGGLSAGPAAAPAYPHSQLGGGPGAAGGSSGGGIPGFPPMPGPFAPPMFGGLPMMHGATMGGGVPPGMPYPMPWSFNFPPPATDAMKTGMPPPQSLGTGTGASAGAGGFTGGTGPGGGGGGAGPVPFSMSMPPPPPPFPYAQTVTIGDRVYQLPPGSTLQFMPVITPGSGSETDSGADGGRGRSGPGAAPGSADAGGGAGAAAGGAAPTTGHNPALPPPPHLDSGLPFSTRPSQRRAET